MTAPSTTDGRKSSALTAPVSQQNAPVGVDHSRPSVRLLRPIAEPSAILESQEAVRELVEKALKKDRDYGKIEGIERSTLFKPGAERVALAFGCKYGDPEIIESEVNHDRVVPWTKRKKEWYTPQNGGKRRYNWKEESGTSYGLYRFVIRRAVIELDTGRVVGHGIGSCSTLESKYIDRPRDSENTVLKMASKRAMIDACLTTFGLSDQFTQDVEDLPRDAHPGVDADRDERANEPEPITIDTPWPNGVNAGKPIAALPNEFLKWAVTPGRKFGPRTAEWVAACQSVVDQRAKCEKLGCDPAGRWHDEECTLFIETDPPEGATAAAGSADAGDAGNPDEFEDEPGATVNR